jgi:hypothetical protein
VTFKITIKSNSIVIHHKSNDTFKIYIKIKRIERKKNDKRIVCMYLKATFYVETNVALMLMWLSKSLLNQIQ